MARKKDATTPRLDYHRICFRSFRNILYENELPFSFTPETDIDDHWKRYDIHLVRTSDKDFNGGVLFDGVKKHIVGEIKGYHKKVTYKEYLQAMFYAIHETLKIKKDDSEEEKGVTGMLLCSDLGEELENDLKTLGQRIEPRGNGVYNVIGVSGVDDFRIIIMSELPGDEYACLRIICEGASKKDIVTFLKRSKRHRENAEVWRWIDEIRSACMQINPKNYYDAMLEVEEMEGFDREYFDRICWSAREQQMIAARNEGINEGVKKGYKQGIEQGIEQGLEQGIEQGIEQGVTNAISDMLAMAKDGVVSVEQLIAYQTKMGKLG